MSLDPVVGFFVLGLLAGAFGSDLKLSGGLTDALIIYLLIAIGLKGGFELSQMPVAQLIVPIVAVVVFSAVTPLVGYQILRRMGRLPHPDAASISAHYGSVSVVTFAVGAYPVAHRAFRPRDPGPLHEDGRKAGGIDVRQGSFVPAAIASNSGTGPYQPYVEHDGQIFSD